MENGKKILIVCATLWEVRKTLKDMEFQNEGGNLYRKSLDGGSLYLAICGIGQENARKSLETHLKIGPGCVLSTGFAGGLTKEVRAGDLVIDGTRSEPRLIEILESRLSGRFEFHKGSFWCGSKILFKAAEKLQKGLETSALAAEMESQALFEICKDRKIPFLSLRAISDPVETDLPDAIAQIRPDGSLGRNFWFRLISSPSQWMPLLQLFKNSNAAGKNLSRALSAVTQTVLKEDSWSTADSL